MIIKDNMNKIEINEFSLDNTTQPKNKLLMVGKCCGYKETFLNLTKDKVKERMLTQYNIKVEDDEIEIIEFDDEFVVYDAWEK